MDTVQALNNVRALETYVPSRRLGLAPRGFFCNVADFMLFRDRPFVDKLSKYLTFPIAWPAFITECHKPNLIFFENLGVCVRIILKLKLKDQDERVGLLIRSSCRHLGAY